MFLYKDIDKLVSTTHDTVNKLLEFKNWPDSLALYFRYIQQRKMQENHDTFSCGEFMQKAMWRWKQRFSKAKKVLIETWLVENIQKRGDDWEFWNSYIRVNFVISVENDKLHRDPTLPDDGNPGRRESGSKYPSSKVKYPSSKIKEKNKEKKISETNLDDLENNEDETKKLTLEKYLESRNKIIKIGKRKWFKHCRKITPDIEREWYKIKKKYDDDDIVYGTENYAKDIKNRADDWSWYCEHRFSLYEFLKQSNALARYINQ